MLQINDATNKRGVNTSYYLGPFGGGWRFALGIKCYAHCIYFMLGWWAIIVKW